MIYYSFPYLYDLQDPLLDGTASSENRRPWPGLSSCQPSGDGWLLLCATPLDRQRRLPQRLPAEAAAVAPSRRRARKPLYLSRQQMFQSVGLSR
jgi:hypothetical protein